MAHSVARINSNNLFCNIPKQYSVAKFCRNIPKLSSAGVFQRNIPKQYSVGVFQSNIPKQYSVDEMNPAARDRVSRHTAHLLNQ